MTCAKSFNLHIIRKLIRYFLKKVPWKYCLLLLILRYHSSKVGRYSHPPSMWQGAKGLICICFPIGAIMVFENMLLNKAPHVVDTVVSNHYEFSSPFSNGNSLSGILTFCIETRTSNLAFFPFFFDHHYSLPV